MKKAFHFILFFTIILFFNSKAQDLPFGIWQFFGDPINNAEIKGRLVQVYWQDIEPENDQWNWEPLDNQILSRSKDANNVVNLSTMLAIYLYTQPDKNRGDGDPSKVSAPYWLHSAPLNIPMVEVFYKTAITGDKMNQTYVGYTTQEGSKILVPYYRCDKYKEQFQQMVTAVKNHIVEIITGGGTYTANMRKAYKKLAAIQGCYGSTGDYISYKGDETNPPDYIEFGGNCDVTPAGGGTPVGVNTTLPSSELTPTDFAIVFKDLSQIYYDAYYIHEDVGGINGWHPIVKSTDLQGSTMAGVRILQNPGNQEKTNDDWLKLNCLGTWRKAGLIGHNYQTNYENDPSGPRDLSWWKQTLNQKYSTTSQSFDYDFVRGRCEFAGQTKNQKWWTGEAPVPTADCNNDGVNEQLVPRTQALENYGYLYKNLFTLYAYMLRWGMDWANPLAEWFQPADYPYYEPAFKFFNKYAGQKNGPRAVNGFCMLRQGLDTYDTQNFPVNTYDAIMANGQINSTRLYKIAFANSNNGALLEDPCSAAGYANENRRTNGINDVGVKILPGNYERYVYQINPDPNSDDINQTSIGYWNVLASSTSNDSKNGKKSMYGRFARAIVNNGPNPKNTMSFKLDGAFYKEPSDAPGGKFLNTAITITYLDDVSGVGWDFYYNKYVCNSNGIGGNPVMTKQGNTILLTGTNEWKQVTFSMNDGFFGGSSTKVSDFKITTTSTQPIKFALVEVQLATDKGSYQLCNIGLRGKKYDTVNNAINIFPNPALQNFTVKSSKNEFIKQIKIYNHQGQMVFTKSLNQVSIMLSKNQLGNLPGLYFVRATLADGTIVQKELSVL